MDLGFWREGLATANPSKISLSQFCTICIFHMIQAFLTETMLNIVVLLPSIFNLLIITALSWELRIMGQLQLSLSSTSLVTVSTNPSICNSYPSYLLYHCQANHGMTTTSSVKDITCLFGYLYNSIRSTMKH
jgi:hypothetical protein